MCKLYQTQFVLTSPFIEPVEVVEDHVLVHYKGKKEIKFSRFRVRVANSLLCQKEKSRGEGYTGSVVTHKKGEFLP